MPHDPLPILATWLGGIPQKVDIQFDEVLSPAALDHLNWRVWRAPDTYAGAAAVVVGDTVNLTLAAGAPAPGPDRVSYMPPPFDVGTPGGGFAAAFEDYPLV